MSLSKKFLHDRTVLLLISLNSFFMLFGFLSVLLRLGGGKTGSYIVEYRSNLGLSAYKPGDSTDLFKFVLFGLVSFIVFLAVSIKVYSLRRYVAVASLGLCLIILALSLVVSNALLVSR